MIPVAAGHHSFFAFLFFLSTIFFTRYRLQFSSYLIFLLMTFIPYKHTTSTIPDITVRVKAHLREVRAKQCTSLHSPASFINEEAKAPRISKQLSC